jgi:hypothetical protein
MIRILVQIMIVLIIESQIQIVIKLMPIQPTNLLLRTSE